MGAICSRDISEHVLGTSGCTELAGGCKYRLVNRVISAHRRGMQRSEAEV